MEERLHRVEATGSQIIDEAEANEARREINGSGKRRSRFGFSMIGLEPGDEIIFKDDSRMWQRIRRRKPPFCVRPTGW